MPKARKEKSSKPIHPNSRKAAQIARSTYNSGKKADRMKDKATKMDITVNKLLWFQNNMDDTIAQYDRSTLAELVEKYIHRFDEELQQIEIVHGIGRRRPTQHAARERALTLTRERETMLLRSSGIEIPDLLNRDALQEFRGWNGDAKYLPKVKLIKYTNPKLKT